MLVCKLYRTVDAATLLGDVELDLQLLLDQVITVNTIVTAFILHRCELAHDQICIQITQITEHFE